MIVKYAKKSMNNDWTNEFTYTDLICDCHCGLLRFERINFDVEGEGEDWISYEFSFMDNNLGSSKHNIFKRLWYAITGKPLFYKSVSIDNKVEAIKFLDECRKILDE